MKKLPLNIMSALILARSLFAGEPDTAALEKGYRAEAEKFGKCLADRLTDPATHDRIVAGLRAANEDPKSEKEGFTLESISLSPPSLRQDPNDLYQRFRSVIVVHIRRLELNGQPTSPKFKPYEIILPTSASPEMAWSFPPCENAIDRLTEQCNDAALTIANLKLEIARIKHETEKLTGKKKP